KSAADFARDVLARALGTSVVVIGSNFRFGRDRAGDAARLGEWGRGLGFRVETVGPVMHDGAPISSTRIREALARGAVDAAAELLGRRFFIDGVVQRGDGRGRTIGFPTANLRPDNETLPGGGVYAAWARLEGETALRPAVVNIGHRPTFGGTAIVIE